MNKGMDFNTFLMEVARREEEKKDYVLDAEAMRMDNGALTFGEHRFSMNDLAKQQMAAFLNIPLNYYRRMEIDRPELLDENINSWLTGNRQRRFVRTINDRARAVLSDRFRPYDNAPVLMAFMEFGQKGMLDGIEVRSANVTDDRMYIQIVNKRRTGEVKKGEYVQSGLVISNSEVGLGRYRVEEMLFVLACLNGAIYGEVVAKTHIGGRLAADGIEYRKDTLDADVKLLNLQVRDILDESLGTAAFDRMLVKAQRAANMEIPADRVEPVIEEVTERFSLGNGSKDNILAALIKGKDFSRWGLSNALTYQAHEIEDYDASVDLQRIGGNIVSMSDSDWNQIVEVSK